MANDILSFQGEYRWLSNFHLVFVTFEGLTYPSVEHAYQAAKARPEDRGAFVSGSPGEAKRLGRRVPGFNQQRWDERKVGIMFLLLRAKFCVRDLRDRLIATGDAQLIEGNYWNDTFWGVCRGKGENRLGRLLMELRDELAA